MQGISKHMLPGKAAEADRPVCNTCTGAAVDRTQFNYGRCLPWLTRRERNEPVPQDYIRTEMLRAAIAKRATVMSNAEFALQEALRNVRHSDTETEYELALARLAQIRVANDPLGIDSTFNVANMPNEATPAVSANLEPVKDACGMGLEPTGDLGNGHVFYDGCGK